MNIFKIIVNFIDGIYRTGKMMHSDNKDICKKFFASSNNYFNDFLTRMIENVASNSKYNNAIAQHPIFYFYE